VREMGDWGHISRIFTQRLGPPLGALAVIAWVDEQIQVGDQRALGIRVVVCGRGRGQT
jgi:hypothetical protein